MPDIGQRNVNRNGLRDAERISALSEYGFRVRIIWECDVRDGVRLAKAIEKLFPGGG